MMPMRNILVTGAAGYIAGRLIALLCDSPWVEKVIGTDIREPGASFAKFVFDRRDVREAMDDIFERETIDTVVHTAYVLPPIHDKNRMEAINIGGTRNILAAAVRAGVRQVLYTSSTTAYGFFPDNDRPLTEESPLRGNADFTYAKNKREIEQIFKAFVAKHSEIAVSIVRPCYVIGPGIANPLSTHLKKKFVVLPANPRPWQFVHEDDVARAMLLLIKQRQAGVYNIAGEGTLTFDEMVRMMGNMPLYLPWRVLYPLNNLAWHLRLSFVTEFPSPAMRMMIHPWIASSDRLVRETGFEYAYSTRAAFADFVRAVGLENRQLRPALKSK